VRAPLGLYLGWISVAAIANIAGALVGIGWDGFGISPNVWSLVILVVAAALALAGLWRDGDGVFALVFVWALVGVKVASASAIVGWIALALAAFVGLAVVARAGTRRQIV
jgi:hypothetical protein